MEPHRQKDLETAMLFGSQAKARTISQITVENVSTVLTTYHRFCQSVEHLSQECWRVRLLHYEGKIAVPGPGIGQIFQTIEITEYSPRANVVFLSIQGDEGEIEPFSVNI